MTTTATASPFKALFASFAARCRLQAFPTGNADEVNGAGRCPTLALAAWGHVGAFIEVLHLGQVNGSLAVSLLSVSYLVIYGNSSYGIVDPMVMQQRRHAGCTGDSSSATCQSTH